MFGAPNVTLTVSADRPIAALAIRLNEVSPKTGASHLVCYRFCNLADRSGDLAAPQRVEPGVPFSFRVVLNMMGHTFKKGWRIRLALSPSFYPTLWESPEAVTITLHMGEADGLSASALMLPGRPPRDDDKRAAALLPLKSAGAYVNPDDYLPTLAEVRPAATTRKATPVTINGKPGMLTRKVFELRPLPIWRGAARTMGRSNRRGEFRDGDRRPALAQGLHHNRPPPSSGPIKASRRARRPPPMCGARLTAQAAMCSATSPPSRPSSAKQGPKISRSKPRPSRA